MKIKINGLNWTVKNEPVGSDNLLSERGQPCFGVTEFPTLTISLRNDMPLELYRQTVIHELLHAYTFSFGVHLFANDKTEEPIADFVGSHLDHIHNHTNQIMDKLFGKG